MPPVCEICIVRVKEGTPPFFACEYEEYSEVELELMGVGGELAPMFRCDATAHASCYARLARPRDCCAPPALVARRCFRHSDWPNGFVCIECERWHATGCASEGVINISAFPEAICNGCARAARTAAAVSTLKGFPLETLEAMAAALRIAEPDEAAEIGAVLEAIGDFRTVQVPNARTEKLSLRVLTRALNRLAATARVLESGLERECFELLSHMGLESDFRAQQTIAVDVAHRGGAGRRSIAIHPDFSHKSLPYVIFLDGRTAHSSEVALITDGEITAELNLMGFLVRRFRPLHFTSNYRKQTISTIRRDIERLQAVPVRRALL